MSSKFKEKFDYRFWYLIWKNMKDQPFMSYINSVHDLFKKELITETQYESFFLDKFNNIACTYAANKRIFTESQLPELCPREKPRYVDICCFCPLKVKNIIRQNCLNGLFQYIDELTAQLPNYRIESERKYRKFRNDRRELIDQILKIKCHDSVEIDPPFNPDEFENNDQQ